MKFYKIKGFLTIVEKGDIRGIKENYYVVVNQLKAE
jgi:hypothetical protein